MGTSIFDEPTFSEALFFPRQSASPAPPGSEDRWLLMPDGARIHVRLHGLSQARVALVHFHGNGEVVADWDALGAQLAPSGIALVCVEYRGYGQSTATPSLRACQQDAASAVEQLRAALVHDGVPLPVVVMGRSLGGVVAASLMSVLPRFAAGWVLESAASELESFVARRGHDPAHISAEDRATFDPHGHLARCRAPLLVIHGTRDQLVPPSNAQASFERAGSSSRELLWLDGHGHNDAHLSPDLLPGLRRFVLTCAEQADRRAGSLVTQGLGDALGFLVEGEHPVICAEFVRQTFAVEAPPTRLRGPFSFGQYSDDTQLARELARTLVEAPGWQPEAMAERVAAIFREDRIVGRGRATENAARRLIAGISWDQAGEPPPRAGNGGAMRAAPVGLVVREAAQRRLVADEQARITHADPRARAAALLVAEVVAGALQDEDPLAPSALDGYASAVASLAPALAAAVRQLPRWASMEPAQAMDEVARVGLEDESKLAGSRWHGISPMATCSTLASLLAYALAPRDPEKALGIAIAAGGDVDTVAAMTGAMVGARVGLRGLPERLSRWARLLNDQGTDGLATLVALGHAMAS